MQYEQLAGLVEIGFVYAVLLAFGVWQLISVRRQLRQSRDSADGSDRRERSDT